MIALQTVHHADAIFNVWIKAHSRPSKSPSPPKPRKSENGETTNCQKFSTEVAFDSFDVTLASADGAMNVENGV